MSEGLLKVTYVEPSSKKGRMEVLPDVCDSKIKCILRGRLKVIYVVPSSRKGGNEILKTVQV